MIPEERSSSVPYTSQRNTTKNIFVWCERLSVWKHCPRVGRSSCRKRQQGGAQDPELRDQERSKGAIQINWIVVLQNADTRSLNLGSQKANALIDGTLHWTTCSVPINAHCDSSRPLFAISHIPVAMTTYWYPRAFLV